MSASQLASWLRIYQSLPPPHLIVEVSPPPKKSLLLPSAIPTFSVITLDPIDSRRADVNHQVTRTSQDFNLLRSTLLARFPGVVVAHLPEGHAGDFVKDRRRLSQKSADIYTHWLRAISRHPFLSQDEAFFIFLSPIHANYKEALETSLTNQNTTTSTTTNKKSFKFLGSLRRQSSSNINAPSEQQQITSEPRIAPDYWALAVELSPTVSNAEKATKEFANEVDQVEKTIHTLKDSVRALVEKIESTSTAHSDICRSLSTWLALEYSPTPHTLVTDDGGGGGGEDTSAVTTTTTMPSIISRAAFAHESSVSKLNRLASQLTSIMGAIRFESLVLRAFKTQLGETASRIDALAKAEKKLEQKSAELETAIRNGGGDRKEVDQFSYQDVHDEILERKTRAQRKARDDAVEARDAILAQTNRMCKCTLNIERELFRNEHTARADRMFKDFAHMEMVFATEFHGVWEVAGSDALSQQRASLPGMDPGLSRLQGPSMTPSPSPQRTSSLQTSQAALMKSGVLSNNSNNNNNNSSEESKTGVVDDGEEEEEAEEQDTTIITNESSLPMATEVVEQEEDEDEDDDSPHDPAYEPWDTSTGWVATDVREIKVAYDFDAEESDELTVRAGDIGVAGPFDVDRQWLMVKTRDGEGLVPTDFVLCRRRRDHVVAVNEEEQQSMSPTTLPITHAAQEVERLQGELGSAMRALDESDCELAIARTKLTEVQHDNEALTAKLDEAMREIARLKDVIAVVEQQSQPRRGSVSSTSTSGDHNNANASLPHGPTTTTTTTTTVDANDAVDDDRATETTTRVTAAATTILTTTIPTNMPQVEGWIIRFDPRYNRHFYYSPTTKQSVWKLPSSGAAGTNGDGNASTRKRKTREDE